MKKILFALPIITLVAAGCSTPEQTNTQTTVTTSVDQTTSTPASVPVTAPNPKPQPKPMPTPTTSAKKDTITLDAATKLAIVKAVMNSFDIFSSNDPVKIRAYFLTELQTPEQIAQFKAMTDKQLLQVAAAAIANTGKPSTNLATDPTAVWKLDGNTASVTTKSNAKPNPDHPAIAALNVTYQAVFINGTWY